MTQSVGPSLPGSSAPHKAPTHSSPQPFRARPLTHVSLGHRQECEECRCLEVSHSGEQGEHPPLLREGPFCSTDKPVPWLLQSWPRVHPWERQDGSQVQGPESAQLLWRHRVLASTFLLRKVRARAGSRSLGFSCQSSRVTTMMWQEWFS